MKEIKIVLPDGSVRLCDHGKTVKEIIASWKKEMLPSIVAAKLDGKTVDLSHLIEEPATMSLITIESKEGLEILRHSISHVMAQAVKDLFEGVQITIGPSIEEGFYYDFDYSENFTPEDLAKIEERMRAIVTADYPFAREEMSRQEAISFFRERGETYKVELLKDLPEDVRTISLYSQGGYVDLCRGPHIPSTGMIRAFKLLNVAGAYWRGDEKNKMLQRIYGTGFATEKALAEYLHIVEEAKKRDHRKLGKELDLFQMNDEAGPGLIIFHPKGARLRNIIEDWERKEHLKRGYDMVAGAADTKSRTVEKIGAFRPLQGKYVFHGGR